MKNANVSVLVDDEFFEKVRNDGDIEFSWRNNEVGKFKAKELWNMMIHNSYQSGEPGILNEGLKNIYHQIESLFLNTDSYLDFNYTSASISADTGIRSELIRNSIKVYSEMSVPLFINSYRIKYAIKLIDEDYLQNYSMEALAEKSGFSSQENFNRVFKVLKSCTPTEYLNSKKRS